MHPSMYERDMDHILSIQNSRKGESFPLPGYQTLYGSRAHVDGDTAGGKGNVSSTRLDGCGVAPS